MPHSDWTPADVDWIGIQFSPTSDKPRQIIAYSNDLTRFHGLDDDNEGWVASVGVRHGLGELDDPVVVKMLAAYNDTARVVRVYFVEDPSWPRVKYAESLAHFTIESPTNPGLREPKTWMLGKSLFFNQLPVPEPTAPTAPPTGTIGLVYEQHSLNLYIDHIGRPTIPTTLVYEGNSVFSTLRDNPSGLTWYQDVASIPVTTTPNLTRWQITATAATIGGAWMQTGWSLTDTQYFNNARYYLTETSNDAHNPQVTADRWWQRRVDGGAWTPRQPLSGRFVPNHVGSNQYLASPTVQSREFNIAHFVYDPDRILHIHLKRLDGLANQNLIFGGNIDIPMRYLRPVASNVGPITTGQAVRFTVTKDGITGFTASTLSVSDGFDVNNKINHIIQLKFVAGSTTTVGSVKVWFPNQWVTYGIDLRT